MLRGATLWHIWCARYRLDSYSESMNWEEMCHKVETSYHDNDLILILLISPQVVGSEREVARYQPKTTTLKCVLVRVVVVELILECTLHRTKPFTLGSILIPVMTHRQYAFDHTYEFMSPLLKEIQVIVFTNTLHLADVRSSLKVTICPRGYYSTTQTTILLNYHLFDLSLIQP